MSKYPFIEYVDEYMATMRGVWAEATWVATYRRYRRQSRDFIRLKHEGRISSSSPKMMTPEDIREFFVMRRNMDLSPSELRKEIVYLRELFDFCESKAVDAFLRKYPPLIPPRKEARLPSMNRSQFQKILDSASSIDPDDWTFNRAYALVLIVGAAGLRTKEVRYCDIENLDTEEWVLDIIHVKGEDTYGYARCVPIAPDVRPILTNYLRLRGLWAEEMGIRVPALFPSMYSDDGYLSGNSLRYLKTIVEDDSGVEFDFRKLRRTFGQELIDNGVKLDSVSVLMGHATTNTTEKYYARRKNSQAIDDVKKTWGYESAVRRRL